MMHRTFNWIFLITLLLLGNSTFAASIFHKSMSLKLANSTLTCVDPTLEEMKELLSKMYEYNIDRIIDDFIIYYPPNWKSFAKSIVSTKQERPETQNCSRTRSIAWDEENGIATCPHKFVRIRRDNLFPYERLVAQCLCSRCLHLEELSENQIACRPSYITNFALKRGQCQSSGVFEWVGALEKVPVSCTCSQASIII